MKRYLLAVVAALAMGGPAMAHEPVGVAYEARAQVSGFLCALRWFAEKSYDWRSMADTGVRSACRSHAPDHQRLSQDRQSMGNEGANLFNTGVMQDGADATCAEAARDVVQARALIARDR